MSEQERKIIQDCFAKIEYELQHIGLPSVSWCADGMHLSTNYFGDLIKKETGVSAQAYVQSKVANVAKVRIFDQRKSISEIAY